MLFINGVVVSGQATPARIDPPFPLKRGVAAGSKHVRQQDRELTFRDQRPMYYPLVCRCRRSSVHQLQALFLTGSVKNESEDQGVSSDPALLFSARLELFSRLQADKVGQIRDVMLHVGPHGFQQLIGVSLGRGMCILREGCAAQQWQRKPCAEGQAPDDQ